MARAFFAFLVAAIATVSWVATCALCHYRDMAAAVGALEPRAFDRLTLITVGTGGAYENPKRLGPCMAVGFGKELVLVDAGRGVAEALRRARIPAFQPQTVYLSSLLPENTVGLDDLALTGWLEGRSTPLRLVGPPGTRAFAAALARAHAAAVTALAQRIGLDPAAAGYQAIEAGSGWSESVGALGVKVAVLQGGPLPALAYRFEAGRHAIVIGGTGWDPEALVELARGADLLVHEALHQPSVELAIEAGNEQPERLRREADLHTKTTEVGSLAQRAGVRQLVLVRLRPPPLFGQQFRSLVGQSFKGEVIVASDGQEITP